MPSGLLGLSPYIILVTLHNSYYWSVHWLLHAVLAVAPSSLGSSAILAELRSFHLRLKSCCNAPIKSCFTVSQHFFVEQTDMKPSGPGAFWLGASKIARFISSSVIWLSSCCRSCVWTSSNSELMVDVFWAGAF